MSLELPAPEEVICQMSFEHLYTESNHCPEIFLKRLAKKSVKHSGLSILKNIFLRRIVLLRHKNGYAVGAFVVISHFNVKKLCSREPVSWSIDAVL